MFLHSLTIKNVRSIKLLHLDFANEDNEPRRWTLLLGENGCGKSSVLRIIALLLCGSEGALQLISDPDRWIRNGENEAEISAELRTADGASRQIRLSILRNDTSSRLLLRNKDTLKALDDAIARSNHNYFVAGYGVSRGPASGVAAERREVNGRAAAVQSLFSHESHLISLEQWAMDLDYRRSKVGIDIIRDSLSKLLPGMTLKKIDKRRKALIFDTIDGDVPFSELSDGYQSMASWCGDLLYRIMEAFPKNRDPLHARGVLLIDELDLHLHPVWRRRLVEFLDKTFPNLQIIATTHSALTAQQCDAGELYVIRREGRGHLSRLIPFQGVPKNMMLHQLLMSPLFGLSSLDSIDVEETKKSVRKIADKPVTLRTKTEQEKLKKLRNRLVHAPDWDVMPEFEKAQTALLKTIRGELESRNNVTVSVEKVTSRIKQLKSN